MFSSSWLISKGSTCLNSPNSGSELFGKKDRVMVPVNDAGFIRYRLIVIEPRSQRVLVIGKGGSPSLPCALVDPSTRTALALTDHIGKHFGISTVLLSVLGRNQQMGPCAVHEVIRGEDSSRLSLKTIDAISAAELLDQERLAIVKIMRGEAAGLGQFDRLGWLGEFMHETRKLWSSRPVVRHIHHGSDFCLMNFSQANGPNWWFKAVGEPNSHELSITAELARNYPKYLPKIVAPLPAWNGWIAENVAGEPLNQSTSQWQWKEILETLAIMQRDSAKKLQLLCGRGAKVRSLQRLQSYFDPFFEEARSAMLAQTSTKVRAIANQDLDCLRKDIERAFSAVSIPELPDTVLHGDLGPGNLILSPHGPVFLDWAEAGIGHPFVTAEHLLAIHQRFRPEQVTERHLLRHFYAEHWEDCASTGLLERVLTFSPAVAVFAYALCVWDRNRSQTRPTRTWPLLRSLVRRTRDQLDRCVELKA